MSSGKRRFAVRPGGGLVVGGAGLQASVQDADEAVGEPAERVVVVVSFGALLVVEGACSGGRVQRREGPGHQGVDEPVVVDEPGGDDFLLAGGAGDRAGAAVVLAGFRADVGEEPHLLLVLAQPAAQRITGVIADAVPVPSPLSSITSTPPPCGTVAGSARS